MSITGPPSPPTTGNSEIEEEIRRQLLAEREAAQQRAVVAQTTAGTPRPASGLEKRAAKGGWIGTLAAVLLLVAKFAGPALSSLKFLSFGKFFLTGGSMIVSMFAYALSFGWPMGVGLVLSIFVHECGHAYAAWRRGLPFSFMVFIPFMGAMVAHKRGGKNIAEDAYIGIMGPVWGTLFGVASVALFLLTGQRIFLALAILTFFLNLFNLAPVAPLDGGWIVPLFSPKLLALGVVLLFFIAPRNPLIWLLALMSLPRIIGGWKAKPDENPYYQATAADRWRYGLAYGGLIIFLALGYLLLNDFVQGGARGGWLVA